MTDTKSYKAKREEAKAKKAYRVFRTNFLTGLQQQLARTFKEQEMSLIDMALKGGAFQVNIHCVAPEAKEEASPNKPIIELVSH